MLKNLKHSIVFILVVITLLFVVVMSLAASKPVLNINTAAVSSQNGNESKYGKWSGLGMHIYPAWESYVDTLLANGFEELAMGVADYEDATYLSTSKASVINIIAKGARVSWGITCGTVNTITATNWGAFRTAVLAGAQWAQDNGVFEFRIGNELEYHHDNKTLTTAQLIINLKSLATEVQAIFTNGNISYSCGQGFINDWAAASKGDIDIIASNIYMGGTTFDVSWKTNITNLVNAFGTDGTYLTEFNLSWSSLDDYSTDETVQATALTEMINYIKASGMTRAFYFAWKDDGAAHFGVMKADGTYRLLWNQALLNSGL